MPNLKMHRHHGITGHFRIRMIAGRGRWQVQVVTSVAEADAAPDDAPVVQMFRSWRKATELDFDVARAMSDPQPVYAVAA